MNKKQRFGLVLMLWITFLLASISLENDLIRGIFTLIFCVGIGMFLTSWDD